MSNRKKTNKKSSYTQQWDEKRYAFSFIDYSRRNRVIELLGFKNYKSYLLSALWKKIRKKVLEGAEYKCQIPNCESLAFEVHHNSYEPEVLMGHDLKHLICLCRNHHELAEFDKGGNKRAFNEVRTKLRELGLFVPEPEIKPFSKGLRDGSFRLYLEGKTKTLQPKKPTAPRPKKKRKKPNVAKPKGNKTKKQKKNKQPPYNIKNNYQAWFQKNRNRLIGKFGTETTVSRNSAEERNELFS